MSDLIKNAERIHHAWDAALEANDMKTLLSLYASDCVVESPLIPHLLEQASGICRGHEELKKLLDIVAKRKPAKRQFYRKNFFTDGNTMMWEYPRDNPDGEQMDFVEIMEIENGLIKRHRVYWGWKGISILNNDEYRND